ncbi:hypothetical protein TGARI_213840 [Toxoplasma gondii ARI]|uniref:Transmembrane protein n=1 Tax=Toxoplasma gondii ARI TaxID=1074872 RepID=A0A139XY63_TOXGO|nr:hypothetical protein TGARI_213840 [Toxoplasma gondii ARI]
MTRRRYDEDYYVERKRRHSSRRHNDYPSGESARKKSGKKEKRRHDFHGEEERVKSNRKRELKRDSGEPEYDKHNKDHTHKPKKKRNRGSEVDIIDENLLPGVVKKRHCTDILFLFIFLAGIAASAFVTIVSFHKGDPARLLTGRDFDGAFCGMEDFKTTDQPFIGYTLNVNRVLNSTSASELVDLPFTALAAMTIFSNPKNIMAYLQPVCVASCFSADDLSAFSAGKYERALKFTYKGKILGRFCVPGVMGGDHTTFLPFSDYVPQRLLAGWQQAVDELNTSWPAVVACALVACVVGFLWLIALRLLGGAIVYVAIALFLASFFVAGGVGMWFVHAQAVPAETVRPGEDQGGTVMNSFWIEVTRYSSYAVLGIGGVFAVLMVFLSQRIREGVAVTKVRSANRYE